MSKFTPGPWKAHKWRVVDTQGPDGICTMVICDTANNLRTRTPENESNARLIAAAPELYASLKEFLAIRQAMVDVGGTEGPLDEELIHTLAEMQMGVVDRAESAIAKVEGK